MTTEKKKSRLGLLRPMFAIVLLAIVAYNVPWRDRLVLTAQGTKVEAVGVILGDWRENRIRFRFEAAEDARTGWPATWQAAAASGEPIEVTRAGSGAGVSDPPPGGATDPASDWRPGMLRVFRELDPRGLWIASVFILFGALMSVTRWWRLLIVAGCRATWTSALRLTFLGFFFNLIVPGLTGGDLVKAVLVVRENPSRRADALISVIVDRGLGLVVLVGLAAIVVLTQGGRFADLKLPVTACFLIMLVGLWVAMHPAPRRILRVQWLIDRLPQKERVQSLDRALQIYSRHPWELCGAVALSVLNHLSVTSGIQALGAAFGADLAFTDYLGIASIANTLSSVPISPGGWGVGEAAFGSLFALVGAAPTLGVAVSVTFRLLMMAMGLAGGIFMLMPGAKDVRKELETDAAAS